jgi:hypothetical protein
VVREPLAAFLAAARASGPVKWGSSEPGSWRTGSWGELLEGRALDLQSVQNRLALGRAEGCSASWTQSEETVRLVRWLEMRGRGRRRQHGPGRRTRGCGLRCCGRTCSDAWTRSVLTSATLTTRGGFEYLRARLGLAREVLEGRTATWWWTEGSGAVPLRLLRPEPPGGPTDLPGAQEPGRRLPGGDGPCAWWTRPRSPQAGSFVLFTSHGALRRVAELLREREGHLPGPLFVQGEGPRSRLLRRFVALGPGDPPGHGVLLGGGGRPRAILSGGSFSRRLPVPGAHGAHRGGAGWRRSGSEGIRPLLDLHPAGGGFAAEAGVR